MFCEEGNCFCHGDGVTGPRKLVVDLVLNLRGAENLLKSVFDISMISYFAQFFISAADKVLVPLPDCNIHESLSRSWSCLIELSGKLVSRSRRLKLMVLV
jgi:hypothetical protein